MRTRRRCIEFRYLQFVCKTSAYSARSTLTVEALFNCCFSIVERISTALFGVRESELHVAAGFVHIQNAFASQNSLVRKVVSATCVLEQAAVEALRLLCAKMAKESFDGARYSSRNCLIDAHKHYLPPGTRRRSTSTTGTAPATCNIFVPISRYCNLCICCYYTYTVRGC